jgi:hypothetical protein
MRGEQDDRQEHHVGASGVLAVDEQEPQAHRGGDHLGRDQEQPSLRQAEAQPGQYCGRPSVMVSVAEALSRS